MKFFFLSSLLFISQANGGEIETANLLPPVVCQGAKAAGDIKETVMVFIPRPTHWTALDDVQKAKKKYLQAVDGFMKKGGFFSAASNPRRRPSDGPYNLETSTFLSEMGDEANRYNFYVHYQSPYASKTDQHFQLVRVAGQTYILPFTLSHIYREQFEYADFMAFVSDSVPISNRAPSSLIQYADNLWVNYFAKNVRVDSSPSEDASRVIYNVTLNLNGYCRDGRKKEDLTAKE